MSEISGAAKELAIEYSRTNFTRHCAGKLIDAGTGRGYWEKLALHIQQSIDTATTDLLKRLSDANKKVGDMEIQLAYLLEPSLTNAKVIERRQSLIEIGIQPVNEIVDMLQKQLAEAQAEIERLRSEVER